MKEILIKIQILLEQQIVFYYVKEIVEVLMFLIHVHLIQQQIHQ